MNKLYMYMFKYKSNIELGSQHFNEYLERIRRSQNFVLILI